MKHQKQFSSYQFALTAYMLEEPTQFKSVACFKSRVGDDRIERRTGQPIIEVKVSKLFLNSTHLNLMKMAFFLQMNKRASNEARASV
jgi:hypothetical protein